jgi:NhaP-type Na+/H+ or K+/H+ antiporter
MITFAIIAIILAFVVIIGAVVLVAGGLSFLLTFGDAIICGLILFVIIRAIIRHFTKKKDKKEE